MRIKLKFINYKVHVLSDGEFNNSVKVILHLSNYSHRRSPLIKMVKAGPTTNNIEDPVNSYCQRWQDRIQSHLYVCLRIDFPFPPLLQLLPNGGF